MGDDSSNFHVAAFVIYVYSLGFNLIYVREENDADGTFTNILTYKGFGGKFKYLTFLNFLLQTVYFGLAIVNDVWGSNCRPSDKGVKKTGLQCFMDTFLASLIYPVGTFVVMTFWGIYAVDRELVFPKALDAIIPQWMNHIMHTTVLPILLLEKYFVYHQYPSRKKGLSILMAFAIAYLAWILWVAYYANFWVYPILQVLETHQRVIFFTVLLAFFMSIYILGEAVNNFIWRSETKVKNQRKQTVKAKKIS